MIRTKARPTVKTVTLNGITLTIESMPYCDCTGHTMGFVRRDDGVWVKPCCMRVTEHVFNAHGERPDGHKDCPGCRGNDHRQEQAS